MQQQEKSTSARLIGRRVIRLERVTSTNDIVRDFADRGEPEGLVVAAEEQTAGRGRLNRSWKVPPRSSLQFSVLLRPRLAADELFRIVQIAGLAVAGSLAKRGRDSKLKWPNDVLLNGKKCAGILIETALGQIDPVYVILGIGVNVNFAMRDFPELAADATTVADALGHPVDRGVLFEDLLRSLDDYYGRLQNGEDFLPEWKGRLGAIGRPVRVSTPSGIEEGIVHDVQDDGALVVKRGERLMRFYAGDVTVVK